MIQSFTNLSTTTLRAGVMLALSALVACSKTAEPQPGAAGATQRQAATNRRGPSGGGPMYYQPVENIRQLLTGGSSKTWMLDNTVDAAITVGTEANPTEYFPGDRAGGLPACQADDEYTFSVDKTFTYDAKASTFVAGAFTCQAPRSGTSPFVFGAVGNNLAGLAQFNLARAGGAFIGATDASPTLGLYRVMAIDSRHLVLRAGPEPTGVVFTFKMVAK